MPTLKKAVVPPTETQSFVVVPVSFVVGSAFSLGLLFLLLGRASRWRRRGAAEEWSPQRLRRQHRASMRRRWSRGGSGAALAAEDGTGVVVFNFVEQQQQQ